MSESRKTETPDGLKTCGVGSFGGEESGPDRPQLFRVEAGQCAAYALMHSSQLMACAHQLSLDAALNQNGNSMWASHYLSGMAKALAEDVAHSMMGEEG